MDKQPLPAFDRSLRVTVTMEVGKYRNLTGDIIELLQKVPHNESHWEALHCPKGALPRTRIITQQDLELEHYKRIL